MIPTSDRTAPARSRLTRLRVDLGALQANWRFFQQKAQGAETAAVVKANGYGTGAPEAAGALARAGARTFFTATCGEALSVRAALGAGPRIFVLSGVLREEADAYLSASLTPVLNSLEQIRLWDGRGPAALQLDTGMTRLGVGPEELGAAATALEGVSLTLIMSHLACASDPAHEMNARQRTRFIDAARRFAPAPLSLSASAGILIGPDYHFDLVRPGVGLYGSADLERDSPALSCVATIEAPILQVRDVEPGEAFGYGATAVADRRMRTATAAIGYADGYPRILSNRGFAVFAGSRCRILGRVSMDTTIFDVSACANAEPGAMAEFLGPNAQLDEVAALAGTIPYEILTTFVGTAARTGETTYIQARSRE